MKRYAVLAGLLITHALLISQNATAFFLFRFAPPDSAAFMQKPTYTVHIAPAKAGEYKSGDALQVRYLPDLKMFCAEIPAKYSGTYVDISISAQGGSSPEEMDLLYRADTSADNTNGCLRCMCPEIPFTAGSFYIDMPHMKASWDLIEDISVPIDGTQMVFQDIGMLQNWQHPKEQ